MTSWGKNPKKCDITKKYRKFSLSINLTANWLNLCNRLAEKNDTIPNYHFLKKEKVITVVTETISS